MLSALTRYSFRRLCTLGALAVMALFFFSIGLGFGVHSVFLALKETMQPQTAAVIIALTAVSVGGLILLVLRVSMKPSRPEPLKPPVTSGPADIGMEVGMVLAQHAQTYVKNNPGTTILSACLAGFAAGAAPDKAASLLKAAAKSLQK